MNDALVAVLAGLTYGVIGQLLWIRFVANAIAEPGTRSHLTAMFVGCVPIILPWVGIVLVIESIA